MINKHGVDSRYDRFEASQMKKYCCKSFAMECIRLCSHENRKMGVSGEKKYALRESRKKLVERFYHYQQYDANQEICADIKFTGFDSGPHGGIISHYNFRFDKHLGVGTCATIRIPCLCEACNIQLETPWIKGVPASNRKDS